MQANAWKRNPMVPELLLLHILLWASVMSTHLTVPLKVMMVALKSLESLADRLPWAGGQWFVYTNSVQPLRPYR